MSLNKPFELRDLAVAAAPFVQRLLPGQVEAEERVRVEVRVRSYDDVVELALPTPAPWQEKGRLPVGSILDCYL